MLHLSQLSQRTLAVILPLEIPEPSSRVYRAVSSWVGMLCPVVVLAERVMLLPSAELYMRNMFALLIIVPCARATQE